MKFKMYTYLVIFCYAGLFLFTVLCSGCGVVTSDEVYTISQVTSSYTKVKKDLNKAIEALEKVQKEKHIFDEVEYEKLLLCKERIEGVIARIESFSLTQKSTISKSELKGLWDIVVSAYNDARDIIKDHWEELPGVQYELKIFETEAKDLNDAMEKVLKSDKLDKATKALTVITQAASLGAKLIAIAGVL